MGKIKKEIHVGLTGHRPNKLWGYDLDQPEYDNLQDRLELIIDSLLMEYETVVCHSGLALGADTIWSIAILNKREQYPNRVKFHAEIPFMKQASRWFGESVDFWEYQVEHADYRTLYLPEDEYLSWDMIPTWRVTKALDDRNKGMVEASDIVVAIYDGTKSGTGNAVYDAKELNKYVLTYHPDEFKK